MIPVFYFLWCFIVKEWMRFMHEIEEKVKHMKGILKDSGHLENLLKARQRIIRSITMLQNLRSLGTSFLVP